MGMSADILAQWIEERTQVDIHVLTQADYLWDFRWSLAIGLALALAYYLNNSFNILSRLWVAFSNLNSLLAVLSDWFWIYVNNRFHLGVTRDGKYLFWHSTSLALVG